MRKLSIALMAGAGVLFANGATAADLLTSHDAAYLDASQPSIEHVRMVCDEYGHCVRESRGMVVERRFGDSYAYAPRETYIEQHEYYEQPRPGVALSAPGVRLGITNDLF